MNVTPWRRMREEYNEDQWESKNCPFKDVRNFCNRSIWCDMQGQTGEHSRGLLLSSVSDINQSWLSLYPDEALGRLCAQISSLLVRVNLPELQLGCGEVRPGMEPYSSLNIHPITSTQAGGLAQLEVLKAFWEKGKLADLELALGLQEQGTLWFQAWDNYRCSGITPQYQTASQTSFLMNVESSETPRQRTESSANKGLKLRWLNYLQIFLCMK